MNSRHFMIVIIYCALLLLSSPSLIHSELERSTGFMILVGLVAYTKAPT